MTQILRSIFFSFLLTATLSGRKITIENWSNNLSRNNAVKLLKFSKIITQSNSNDKKLIIMHDTAITAALNKNVPLTNIGLLSIIYQPQNANLTLFIAKNKYGEIVGFMQLDSSSNFNKKTIENIDTGFIPASSNFGLDRDNLLIFKTKDDSGKIAIINYFEVHPMHYETGIGKALLKHCVNYFYGKYKTNMMFLAYPEVCNICHYLKKMTCDTISSCQYCLYSWYKHHGFKHIDFDFDIAGKRKLHLMVLDMKAAQKI